MNPKRTAYLGLLAILITGTLLRFSALTQESLWADEIWSWNTSHAESLSKVLAQVALDVHPPGYQILMFFVQKVLGDSAFHLRLPSALAGILVLFVIYQIGTLAYSWREGLLASSWTAVTWAPIYFSQESRSYSLLLLLSSITMFFWISMVKRTLLRRQAWKPIEVGGYWIAAVGTIYVHYFGLLLVILQASSLVFFLPRLRRKVLGWAGLYLTIFATYIPWLPAFWLQLNTPPKYITPVKFSFFFDFLRFCFNDSWTLMMIVVVGTFLHWIRSRKALLDFSLTQPFRGFEPLTLILWGWLIFPFAVGFAKSLLSNPILTEKNLIISLPAVFLLLARMVTHATKLPGVNGSIGLGLTLIFGLHLILVKNYYSEEPQKQQYREAIQYVIDHQPLADRDSTLLLGRAENEGFFNYYFQKFDSPLRIDLLVGSTEDIPRVLRALEDSRIETVWFMAGFRTPDPEFNRMLNRELDLVDHQQLYFVTVDRYQRKRLEMTE